MQIFQLFRCVVGSHHRSRSLAWRDGNGTYRSRCTGCGKPMIRHLGGWRPDLDPPEPPPETVG